MACLLFFLLENTFMGIIDHGVAIGTELHLPILHGMQEHPAYYQAQRKVHQL